MTKTEYEPAKRSASRGEMVPARTDSDKLTVTQTAKMLMRLIGLTRKS
jgi:hypothetical protein